MSRGIEAYFVGGCVRDAMSTRSSNDIDVAIRGSASAVADDLSRLLSAHVVELDRERDVVRLVAGRGLEAATVDLSSFTDSILLDLSRRDFTIDAMAVPTDGCLSREADASLLDPYGGAADLRAGILRSLGEQVFTDDPARLVRAPRLAAQLGFVIEPATFGQIRRNAGGVNLIAPERLRDEFMKLLKEPGTTSALRLLDDLQLLTAIMPELEQARGVTQPSEHYWDVFDHMIETPGKLEYLLSHDENDEVRQSVPRFESLECYFQQTVADGYTRLTLAKLACLLHDIGKPLTRTVEPTGRIRFLGHHTEGAEVAANLMTRLRFSRHSIAHVGSMVRHHLRPGQIAPQNLLPSKKAVNKYVRDVGETAVDTVYLNLADYLAARGPNLYIDDWRYRCEVAKTIIEGCFAREDKSSQPRLLDGNDIMDTFGIEPGPELGRLLLLVEDAWLEGEIETKYEALALVKAALESGDSNA